MMTNEEYLNAILSEVKSLRQNFESTSQRIDSIDQRLGTLKVRSII